MRAGQSVYVETARGCRSRCSYCFYPRSSQSLRLLSVGDCAALFEQLALRGTQEIVFLDPTFNDRPDLEVLLTEMARLRRTHAIGFFAEVRAEAIRPAQIPLFAAAGFGKLEIGLQSVNKQTLKRIRRGGDPARVVTTATALKQHGVVPMIDLMVGLPGDTAQDVARGVDLLAQHGLADELQLFPLSVLPGTETRALAAPEGVLFEPSPPYHVIQTREMSAEDLRGALASAERTLGRRLDELPRPHLVEMDATLSLPDVFSLNFDRMSTHDQRVAAAPGAAHASLWLGANDLWQQREHITDAIAARVAIDPYATLDVVLDASGPFPLDLTERLARQLADLSPSYGTRLLTWRGENALRRLWVCARDEAALPADFLLALAQRVDVCVNGSWRDALRWAPELGTHRPALRVVGPEA
ncbi:MAG: radical SAM protein, partial [Myxococcota bacterium]